MMASGPARAGFPASNQASRAIPPLGITSNLHPTPPFSIVFASAFPGKKRALACYLSAKTEEFIPTGMAEIVEDFCRIVGGMAATWDLSLVEGPEAYATTPLGLPLEFEYDGAHAIFDWVRIRMPDGRKVMATIDSISRWD